jgi:hypothetical protein
VLEHDERFLLDEGKRQMARPTNRHGRDSIDKIASFAHWSISAVTTLIALVFAGISLKEIPYGTVLSLTNPAYVQAAILTIYVACWAVGTNIDTSNQKSVYLVDPKGGHVRTGWLLAVGGIAVIAVVLLYVRNNEWYLALALAVFSAIDVSAWLYLRYSFLPPIIAATAKKYQQEPDYYGLVRLRTIVAQILGNWKWYRQVFLTAIIVLMLVTAFDPSLADAISQWTEHHLPVPAGSIRPLFQDFLLLCFLLISEIWHFALRLKTFLAVQTLSELEASYSLRPKRSDGL